MATIDPSSVSQGSDGTSQLQVFRWVGITEADTCTPIYFGHYADRSIQVEGTFNGGTLLLEGTLDGTNYVTLKDIFGNALALTAAGIYQISELILKVRPRVSAGAGVSLNVTLLNRRML